MTPKQMARLWAAAAVDAVCESWIAIVEGRLARARRLTAAAETRGGHAARWADACRAAHDAGGLP